MIGCLVGEAWVLFVVAGGRISIGRREQRAAQREFVGSTAVGEETVVADAVKPVRQRVQQEASDELVGRQGHLL